MARSRKRNRKFDKIKAYFLLSILIALSITVTIWVAFGKINFTLALIITIVLFVTFVTLSIVLSRPSIKGKIGERRVSKKINRLANRYGGYVINDVMIPGENDTTSQIDHIYVSPYGIFVFETKNYSGRIYGNDSQSQWTQVLAYGNTKNHFYSPVKQNETHIYRLRKLLDTNVNFYSVIIFVNGNTYYIDSEYVISPSSIKYLISKDNVPTITNEEIDTIVNKIMECKNNPIKTNREHVKEIKQTQSNIKQGICPRCGGELVLRNGRTGQFYGCSNYPKCKFTKAR